MFTDPTDANETLVKRIVGLEGEEIVIQGREVYINFLMADNRNAGEDSRHWGPVSRTRIIGRAAWIYWSSDGAGQTRWSRIGRRVR